MTDPLPHDDQSQLPYDDQFQDAFGAGAIGDNRPPEDADPLRDRLEDTHGALIGRQAALLADAATRAPETIEDEDTAAAVSDYIKELSACVKTLEGARVSEKEPFLKSGRTVDGFFKKMADSLDTVKRTVEKGLTVYQRKVAEEERKRREEEERRAREEAERARKVAEARASALAAETDLSPAIEAEREAEQAAADLARAERETRANAAELSRTRSDKGAVASLRTFWDFDGLDRDTIDLEKLRHHLPQVALESAVRSFVKAGGRKLDGAHIFENTATVVR